MAGHSKWANIKHRKGKADRIKGKIFSRITKEIITAVKHNGMDPKTNTRLRLAIQKAKEANMPSENIERNIKKAGQADQQAFDEVVYEIYGHAGVGIIVQALTDNKNRTASDLRIAMNKKGGVLATPGGVVFNFDKKGVLCIAREQIEEEALFSLAMQLDIEDFEAAEEGYTIVTSVEAFISVKEALQKENITLLSAEIGYLPKIVIDCEKEALDQNLELIEWLEQIDDVDAVFHNMKEGS